MALGACARQLQRALKRLGHTPVPQYHLRVQFSFNTVLCEVNGTQRSRNTKLFQGGLVFEARRLVYHSNLGWRAIEKEEEKQRSPAIARLKASGGIRGVS